MNTNGIFRGLSDQIPIVSISDKCIVLDLDQTLIATQDDIDSLKNLNIFGDPKLMSLRNRTYYISIEDLEKPGIGTKYDFWGVVRPHTQEFLTFCFSYFKAVIVWSAGKRPYVEAIVDHIFKDLPMPHMVFTYDDIIMTNDGHVLKPLEKLINSNPVLKRNMSLKNTFPIDDVQMTYSLNPGNGVLIPAYEPSLNIASFLRDDPSLLQLKYWLLQEDVVNSRDVTLLDKSKIFTTSLKTYKDKLRNNNGYTYIK